MNNKYQYYEKTKHTTKKKDKKIFYKLLLFNREVENAIKSRK